MFPGIGDISGGEGGIQPDLSSRSASGDAVTGATTVNFNPPFFLSDTVKLAGLAAVAVLAFVMWKAR